MPHECVCTGQFLAGTWLVMPKILFVENPRATAIISGPAMSMHNPVSGQYNKNVFDVLFARPAVASEIG